MSFDVWRISLTNEGIFPAHKIPGVFNIAYADNVLLHRKSLQECMIEHLMDTLAMIDLVVNVQEVIILRCNASVHDSSSSFQYLKKQL